MRRGWPPSLRFGESGRSSIAITRSEGGGPGAMNEAVNERQLVERCRRGDEGAFQELVDRYKDLVFALIARTVQDRSRAEDLAQEVFLRIYRGLPYFRGEARLECIRHDLGYEPSIVPLTCQQPGDGNLSPLT